MLCGFSSSSSVAPIYHPRRDGSFQGFVLSGLNSPSNTNSRIQARGHEFGALKSMPREPAVPPREDEPGGSSPGIPLR